MSSSDPSASSSAMESSSALPSSSAMASPSPPGSPIDLGPATPDNLPYLTEEDIYLLIFRAPRKQDAEEIMGPLQANGQQALHKIIHLSNLLVTDDEDMNRFHKQATRPLPERGYMDRYYLPYLCEFTIPLGDDNQGTTKGYLFAMVSFAGSGSYNCVFRVDIGTFCFHLRNGAWDAHALGSYIVTLRRPSKICGSPVYQFLYENDVALRKYLGGEVGLRVPKVYDVGWFPNEYLAENQYMVEEWIFAKPVNDGWVEFTEEKRENIIQQLAEILSFLFLNPSSLRITANDPLPMPNAISGLKWCFPKDAARLGKTCSLDDIGATTGGDNSENGRIKDRGKALERIGFHWINRFTTRPDNISLPYHPGPYTNYIDYGISGLEKELIYHKDQYRKMRKLRQDADVDEEVEPILFPGVQGLGIKYYRFIKLLDGHVRERIESYRTNPTYPVKYNQTAIVHQDFHAGNVLLCDWEVKDPENPADLERFEFPRFPIADDSNPIVLIDWDFNGIYPIHQQFDGDRFTQLFEYEDGPEPERKQVIDRNRYYTNLLKTKLKRLCEAKGMSRERLNQAFGKNANGPSGDAFVELVTNFGPTTPSKYFSAIYFDNVRFRKTIRQKYVGWFWLMVYRAEASLPWLAKDWKPLLASVIILFILGITSIFPFNYQFFLLFCAFISFGDDWIDPYSQLHVWLWPYIFQFWLHFLISSKDVPTSQVPLSTLGKWYSRIAEFLWLPSILFGLYSAGLLGDAWDLLWTVATVGGRVKKTTAVCAAVAVVWVYSVWDTGIVQLIVGVGVVVPCVVWVVWNWGVRRLLARVRKAREGSSGDGVIQN